jgi:hypothetical protein
MKRAMNAAAAIREVRKAMTGANLQNFLHRDTKVLGHPNPNRLSLLCRLPLLSRQRLDGKRVFVV